MERPERLILDWILRVVSDPDRFPLDSEEGMTEFGLTKNQREVVRSRDPSLIRKWIT